MKRTLKILLIIATLIGIAIPAMANPENEPIAVAGNLDRIFVEVDSGNTVNNNVDQSLANSGNQTNWAQAMAISGNALANSANIGYADSGASSMAANSNDSMGDSNAWSSDNLATNSQTSDATSNSGEATGFDSSVDQSNDVTQTATAPITNMQTSMVPVTITDAQGATTTANAVQTIADSMIKESGWTKNVTKNIN